MGTVSQKAKDFAWLENISAPPKHPLQRGTVQLQHRRPAMAAGGGARRCFHLPQQRIHLSRIQAPPCADAAMAGEARYCRIQLAVQSGAFRILGQFLRHIAEQRRGVGGAKQGGQASHQHRAGAEALDFQAQTRQRFRSAQKPRGIGGRQDRKSTRLNSSHRL